MTRVYIASPYTKGDIAVNVKRQIDAASDLIDLGFVPFAPLLSHFIHMMHPKSYEKWLEIDFEWLVHCDCVLRLPGDSDGADKEVDLAYMSSIPVYNSIKELKDYYTSIGVM